jgi:hypothetical protein
MTRIATTADATAATAAAGAGDAPRYAVCSLQASSFTGVRACGVRQQGAITHLIKK